MRTVAITSSSVYLALATAVSLLSLSEQDSNVLTTAALVTLPLATSIIFLRAAVRRSGRLWLLAAWAGMLAGSIVLISFSFVVWPLLLSALPYAITARRAIASA